MNTQDIKDLIKSVGTQGEFADRLAEQIGTGYEVSQQSVSQWLQRGSIPAKFCGHIEAMTGGDFPAHVIRPDVFPSPA